jgi:hypothetical protein
MLMNFDVWGWFFFTRFFCGILLVCLWLEIHVWGSRLQFECIYLQIYGFLNFPLKVGTFKKLFQAQTFWILKSIKKTFKKLSPYIIFICCNSPILELISNPISKKQRRIKSFKKTLSLYSFCIKGGSFLKFFYSLHFFKINWRS